jgi:hypothetical protein
MTNTTATPVVSHAYILKYHGNYVATIGNVRLAFALAQRHGYTVTVHHYPTDR